MLKSQNRIFDYDYDYYNCVKGPFKNLNFVFTIVICAINGQNITLFNEKKLIVFVNLCNSLLLKLKTYF